MDNEGTQSWHCNVITIGQCACFRQASRSIPQEPHQKLGVRGTVAAFTGKELAVGTSKGSGRGSDGWEVMKQVRW